MFPLIPADLLRLVGLALVPLGGAVAGWPSAAVMFLVFGTQWLLRWLVGGRVLDWTGQTVLLAAGWCSVTGLYHRVEHLDLLMHAASSAVIAGLAAVAVRAWLRRRGSSAGAAVRLLGPTLCWAALVSAVGTLGVLWEVAEWIGHRWITAEIGVGYEDTVTDLAANLIGAAAASGWVLRTVEARTAGVPAAEAGTAEAPAVETRTAEAPAAEAGDAAADAGEAR